MTGSGEKPFKVVFAGGGTGGHIIPAIAMADELVGRGGEACFVGTADRIEAKLVPKAGYDIRFIKARPLAGGGVGRKIAGLGAAPISVIRSMRLLGELRPHAVIGVGGYVSGPVVLGAKLRGIPTALLEQNATVGLSNKLLARVVRRAFVTYEDTMGAFPRGRAVHSGNPVKRSILEASRNPREERGELVRLVVMGGSQGAQAIDERVPAAMAEAGLGERVEVLHQCGKGRVDAVADVYAQAGIEARVVEFIDDTAGAFSTCDLVVARSGATTVSEVTVMGLPAVFIPYPHHADRQQEKNAAPMVDAEAAVVLDQKSTDVSDLAAAVARFVDDEGYRRKAAEASRRLGRPDAAAVVIDELMELAGGSL